MIVALDADFLAWGPGRLWDAREFAARATERSGVHPGTSPGRSRRHEPALRRRADADDHRPDGRPPPGRLARKNRAVAQAIAGELSMGKSSGRSPTSRIGSPRTPAGSMRWRATSRPPGQEPGHRGRRRSRPRSTRWRT